MNVSRFILPIVGFAAATAQVAASPAHENAAALSAGAIAAGGAIVLCGWRSRLRGVNDWHAALAAVLALLTCSAQLGSWIACAAWLAAAGCAFCIDRRRREGAVLCAIASAALSAAGWKAIAAPVYLGTSSPAFAGFVALVAIAAWYGMRRPSHPADAPVFFVLLAAAIAEPRLLPFFGIVCAPAVADALASYYLAAREMPRRSTAAHLAGFCAAAAVLAALIAMTSAPPAGAMAHMLR